MGDEALPSATLTTRDSPAVSVDQNHPYYLAPSDTPDMNLLNVTFDGTGYENWRKVF